jgi:hypothetical protein
MRFILVLFITVSVLTVATVVGVQLLLPASLRQPPASPVVQGPRRLGRVDAIQLVASRLASTPRAYRLRRKLAIEARVTHDGPNHLTVQLGDARWACATESSSSAWYAEAENAEARRLEAEVRPREAAHVLMTE